MKTNKDTDNSEETPSFVSRDGILADKEYVTWLSDVKHRYRQSQVRASVRVNTTMLEFYWSVGRDLVRLRAEQKWGAGVVKQFALDMRETFPNEKGFSYTNVKYMKRWYLFYYERVVNGQQLADFLEKEIGQQVGDLIETGGKGQQAVDFLEMPLLFGQIPWGHHIQVFCNCESLDEALFYIKRVANEGWSRSWLEDQIAAHLFTSQGSAITNFNQTLPAPQSNLANELLKALNPEYNHENMVKYL